MKKTKDIHKIIIYIVLVASVLFRIFFISKTDISYYQYDMGIGDINSEEVYDKLYTDFENEINEGRHIDYIMHLYTFNSLPTEIKGQFYHPPMHHFIMASWLKVMDNFTNVSSIKFESMQFVTCIYSIVILMVTYKILEELNVENKYKILPMILAGFYPILVFLSGSINNDTLVIMFEIIALLYLIKWEKDQTILNTIILALSIGLGLMTKSSMYVMVIPAIYVYFKKFAEYVNTNQKIKKLVIELLIFACITISLGFWFPIMSLINGRNTIGIIQPFETYNVSNAGVWNRFGVPSLSKTSDYNVWNYLIYSSINFGILEDNIFMTIYAILVFIFVINCVYYLCMNYKENLLMIITFISWLAFYFVLNYQMPYTCSMHSRYMVIPITIGIVSLGNGLKNEKNKLMKIENYIVSLSIVIMSIVMFAAAL